MRGNKHVRARMPDVLNSILDNYKKIDTLHKVGPHTVPSRSAIATLLEEIETIFYPGYVGRQDVDAANITHYIGERLDTTFRLLSEQIAKSLRHKCSSEHALCDSCIHRGEQQAMTFLAKIPTLRNCLAGDLDAAFKSDPAAHDLDEIVFCYPGFKAITIYRIAHELHEQAIPVMPRIMTEYAHSETGIDIHPGAKIGRRFFIDHGTGVVIGETCTIGDGVKLYQGVTLGAKSFPLDEHGNPIKGIKRHPNLEDNVVVYAGATILGGKTTIGHDSMIGGNVWLTKSVPPHSAVFNIQPAPTIRNMNGE